jgi:dTMP kinase
MATRGRFISFEGIEGVGKTTQLALARELLAARGIKVLTTREPGGTTLAERIRSLVLVPAGEDLPPVAELCLMAAARAVHVANLIAPTLARGDWVLCDRYTDATYAYQGGGRGLPRPLIDALIAAATAGLEPDLTILLDAPVPLALARARSRKAGQDRIEAETLAFFERVRAAYLERARQAPARIQIVDAKGDVAGVAAAIAKLLPG